jgi:hypothetical protein
MSDIDNNQIKPFFIKNICTTVKQQNKKELIVVVNKYGKC